MIEAGLRLAPTGFFYFELRVAARLQRDRERHGLEALDEGGEGRMPAADRMPQVAGLMRISTQAEVCQAVRVTDRVTHNGADDSNSSDNCAENGAVIGPGSDYESAALTD